MTQLVVDGTCWGERLSCTPPDGRGDGEVADKQHDADGQRDMAAATGVRILAGVNFTTNRKNLLIVAVSLGFGMIPLIAPNFKQWMWHDLHPLIESGILLASIAAVALNAFFNGASGSLDEAKAAAAKADH